ncbi:hypothetical protein RJ640_009652 [Escallonia rubra]|uniref:Uncharacterized protein n=1 Tax=Escallonia rubra TaxID=112253 RepID=A0AA88UQI6_9ASTE|nr:hypothetical protein RJ640_009652 [Escallonia rubra]
MFLRYTKELLSPLEVEELDAIGKDEEEEEHPTNMSNYYWYKEVMVITQVLFNEHVHWHCGSFRCCEVCLDVAHLRPKYAVDCPGNWRTPVVPPPPYGDELQESSITTVRPVSTVFLTVRMTIAAALASSPDVGSSMKMIEGLATNSTAMVSLFLCSVERPSTPGSPTRAFLNGLSSTKSITSSTNIYSIYGETKRFESLYCSTWRNCDSVESVLYLSRVCLDIRRKTQPSRVQQRFINAKTSIKVVFPAPLTPTNAVSIPGLKAPLTSLNSCSLVRRIHIPDSINEIGIRRTEIGRAKAHAGKNKLSRCLKNTGSLKTVIASSAIPLNITLTRLKNSAPQNFAASGIWPVFISVLKNTVKAIIAMMVICVVLNTYTNELRFISNHSLEKQALKSSLLEIPYFSFTNAAGWALDLS